MAYGETMHDMFIHTTTHIQMIIVDVDLFRPGTIQIIVDKTSRRPIEEDFCDFFHYNLVHIGDMHGANVFWRTKALNLIEKKPFAGIEIYSIFKNKN